MSEREIVEHPGWTVEQYIFWPDSGACEGWEWYEKATGRTIHVLGNWDEPPVWPEEGEGWEEGR